MIRLLRTNSANPDFLQFIPKLDKELAITDGEDHGFYHQFNGLDDIKHVVLVYKDEFAVACGAIKHYDDLCMEIKRMYVLPEHRGKQYGLQILNELETWSKSLGYQYCILETGQQQINAIKLYIKAEYNVTENYGQYIGANKSIASKRNYV